jgi:hypothetical protein
MSVYFALYAGSIRTISYKKEKKNEAVDFEPHNVFSHCIGESMRKNDKIFL